LHPYAKQVEELLLCVAYPDVQAFPEFILLLIAS
jgi:hypothetical protein